MTSGLIEPYRAHCNASLSSLKNLSAESDIFNIILYIGVIFEMGFQPLTVC